MEKMIKPLVEFRTLADGDVVALCGNLDAVTVNADKVNEYMSKLKELTGGTDVEFNDTFRQICKNRVFFTFEPNIDEEKFFDNPTVPEVMECVLLSDNSVAMNVNGKIVILNPEENNQMFSTKSDAEEAAKDFAFIMVDTCLDALTNDRRQLKEVIKEISEDITKHLNFKNSL